MVRVLVRVAVVLLGLVVAVAGAAFWELSQLRRFAGTPYAPKSEIVVNVPAGLGPKGISDKLAAAGVISDYPSFYRYSRYVGRVAGKLKAGDYLFKADLAETPDEIIDRLMKGEVLSVKVTIPEGLRLDEQAPLFEQAGVAKAADFVRLARDPKFVHSLGIDADNLEGYLFPDTYLVPKNWTTEQVLKAMVDRFNAAFETATEHRSPKVTLSKREAVTLASIVEKETGAPEERPHISCVFHNRLRKGMKLQTDPTVIYSIILRKGSFDGNIHKSDLEAAHPYNTYSVTGLPPGPISNPGLAAFEAALNPMPCDDLYFVSKNNGTSVFCPTLACHARNVQIWQVDYFKNKRAAGKE